MKRFAKHLALSLLSGFSSTAASAEDLHFTATGEEDGKPIIYRSISDIPAGVHTKDFPYRMSIVWRQSPTATGMPDVVSNDQQIEFEDYLMPLDVNTVGRQMLVVTGNDRKEWHWYVKNPDSWTAEVSRRTAKASDYPIKITRTHDPEWSLYKRFIANVRGLQDEKSRGSRSIH